MLINYMATHIESVKLSRDFVVIQHFSFCKLFSKHVSRCFLHRYTTGCTEKRHIYIYIYYVNGSIDCPSRNFNAVNRYTFKPE